MSNRFKFANGGKEKLTGQRKVDREKQICRLAQTKQDTKKDIIWSLYGAGLTKVEVHTFMDLPTNYNRNKG